MYQISQGPRNAMQENQVCSSCGTGRDKKEDQEERNVSASE
jgi:hypothetical protein